MIICLAILVQCWLVTDGRMDGQTHNDSIYHASKASCGKNLEKNAAIFYFGLGILQGSVATV